MMRNPFEHYREEIEQAYKDLIVPTTTEVTDESFEELSEEEILERNNFIMDFIFKQ